MKHFKTVSKMPTTAEDIPVADLMTFVIAVLGAVATLLAAKEATAA